MKIRFKSSLKSIKYMAKAGIEPVEEAVALAASTIHTVNSENDGVPSQLEGSTKRWYFRGWNEFYEVVEQ